LKNQQKLVEHISIEWSPHYDSVIFRNIGLEKELDTEIDITNETISPTESTIGGKEENGGSSDESISVNDENRDLWENENQDQSISYVLQSLSTSDTSSGELRIYVKSSECTSTR